MELTNSLDLGRIACISVKNMVFGKLVEKIIEDLPA